VAAQPTAVAETSAVAGTAVPALDAASPVPPAAKTPAVPSAAAPAPGATTHAATSPVAEVATSPTGQAAAKPASRPKRRGAGQSAGESRPARPTTPAPSPRQEPDAPDTAAETDLLGNPVEPSRDAPARGKSRRAPVPSWDEIMFGARKKE
ncbi:MAG: hypothetical protein M3Q27_14835, partial [Actinomycetota bacterium]|nr:hypothetical protein [Actinomycetota bacterium]